MAHRTETIFVADARQIMDDGPAWAVTLNTTGTTPNREALYEAVYDAGINPDDLHDHEDKDIGTVAYDVDGDIVGVDLDEWVLKEYGYDR